MILRRLKESDAPLMLEWMHDEDLVKDLHKNFAGMTIDDCKSFIEGAATDSGNLHLAIADDNDEYMGTVSLKDINYDLGIAEFGIVIRRAATGKGLSAAGMKEILDYAGLGKELQKTLSQVYWCVNSKNARALRFYDKNGYQRVKLEEYPELLAHIETSGDYSEEEIKNYVWYIYKNGFFS